MGLTAIVLLAAMLAPLHAQSPALEEEQGLRLEPSPSAADVLVVDSVELPTSD
jgi:hypothetical protein